MTDTGTKGQRDDVNTQHKTRDSARRSVGIDVPTGALPEQIDGEAFPYTQFRGRQLTVQVKLTGAQMDGARALFAGLMEEGATLADRSPVRNAPDLVRWLMERIAQEVKA